MNRAAAITVIMSVCTILLRSGPFLLFSKDREIPRYLLFLGEKLPRAIIGMLVIYCLRSVSFAAKPWGIPEAVSLAAVVLLQIFRRNSLLSILGGTVIFMFLVQAVF